MDKTIDRWTDPDGNGYAFKDTVARAQNRATIDKMNAETADRKSELDIERKRIDNLVRALPNSAGEYQQSKMVLHGYGNAKTKCGTTSGQYTNVPAFTTDAGGVLSSLYTKKSNYQIAVNKAGLYLFELRIHINSLTANKRVELAPFVNGERNAALASSYNTAGNFTLTKIATLPMWLSTNDTIDFRITPIEAAEVSVELGDVLVYAIDWDDKFKIPDYTGYVNETKDLRVGVDGTTYDTAGQAMREQIGSLKEDLGDLVTTYHNDKTGKVLGYANGDIGSTVSISSQSWCAHIKVSVIGGTKLYVKTKFDSNYTYVPVVLFCNSGNLVISKLTKSYSVHDYHTEILDVPSDARYAYINISDSDEDVYNNCIAGINYTKISAKEEIDSLKSFDAEAVNRLSFCRVDDSIITSGAGYPIFTEGILNGWGTQSYITHRMFAVNSNKYYAFDANNSVDVYFLDLNKSLIEKKEYTTTSYWYHKIIDVLPLNCSFLIITSNPSNNFVQEPPVCYELFSSNDGIPKYYHLNSYIENKVQAIRNNASIVKGCTFAFITDIHFFFNTLMSGALLKYIKANTPLNLIVCGGDIPPAEGTLEKLNKSAELYNRLTDKLGRNSWLTVKGNHDYCIDGDTPKTMTEGYQYNQIVRPLEISKAILSNGKAYYYYDLPSQKIRFIVLDQYETTNSGDVRYGVMSNVTDEQLSWLANALSVEGYTFLVFSHSSCDSNISGYDSVLAEVNRMLCAVNNKRVYTHSSVHVDFTKTTSIVACSIAGHNHIDLSNMTDGLLSITTTSDAALADGGIARTAGTISEQAFDVFTVDTENKKIKAIRIGGGEDRSWTY